MPVKTSILIAIVLSYFMYWSLSSVCKYNFVLDKKTKIINEISNEINPSLGTAKVYYFKELNCDSAKSEFKYQRIIDNLNHITVYVFQQLTTDIRGIKVEK